MKTGAVPLRQTATPLPKTTRPNTDVLHEAHRLNRMRSTFSNSQHTFMPQQAAFVVICGCLLS